MHDSQEFCDGAQSGLADQARFQSMAGTPSFEQSDEEEDDDDGLTSSADAALAHIYRRHPLDGEDEHGVSSWKIQSLYPPGWERVKAVSLLLPPQHTTQTLGRDFLLA